MFADFAGEFFGGADGEGFFEDLAAGDELGVFVFDGEDGFGVADADLAAGDEDLDIGVEFEQAHGVGDTGAGFADAFGDVVLLHGEFFGEADVAGGFFDGVEVFALKVFDEGHFEHVAIGGFADDNGDGVEAEFFGGAPAAFAGDEFEVVADLADDEWLDDAVLADGFDEFIERGFDEVGAGLERAWGDAVDGHFAGAAGAFVRGSVGLRG